MKNANAFLEAGRSMPAWVAGLAFISTNLGALEVMGMTGSGMKYGMVTTHFYWIGAIPAMIFLALFMMPFYYGSKARSVPEFLKLRYDEKTRALNAILFCCYDRSCIRDIDVWHWLFSWKMSLDGISTLVFGYQH